MHNGGVEYGKIEDGENMIAKGGCVSLAEYLAIWPCPALRRSSGQGYVMQQAKNDRDNSTTSPHFVKRHGTGL
jgi:hypothetical protein